MHNRQSSDSLSNWDDYRVFLEVAKAGSFSSAAKRLHSTQPTISRRIENLEQRLGVRLFNRLPSGIVPTPEGETVLETAQHVWESLVETQRIAIGSDQRLEGLVRVSLTDGLASFWLSPRIGRLHEAYPGLSVEFRCSMEPADILNLESDLSICFRRPRAQDLIAVRLGTLHAVPWASTGYLDRFGAPSTPDELCHHRLLYHEFYRYSKPDCDAWLALLDKAPQGRYLTNSSTSLLSAAQNSVGIALLPTYFCEFADGILPLDLGLRTRSSIWLAYHPDIRRCARIRAVTEWIKGLFDHDAWPWFRNDFHPPKVSRQEPYMYQKVSGVLP
ncbi:MAG: LysR family transcriptional regulator [Kiloniellales bacterium]|nr:LysR family transcriptional regulator [Kiloniellales bacterium]